MRLREFLSLPRRISSALPINPARESSDSTPVPSTVHPPSEILGTRPSSPQSSASSSQSALPNRRPGKRVRKPAQLVDLAAEAMAPGTRRLLRILAASGVFSLNLNDARLFDSAAMPPPMTPSLSRSNSTPPAAPASTGPAVPPPPISSFKPINSF